jgi:4-hydroxybenzoate polyprenyltransferase
MKYLKLIRVQNLLFIILAQVLIRFFLFEPFNIAVALSHFDFLLLVIATSCIAAAGYIINDLYDIETDSINKKNNVLIGKSISEKSGYNLYFVLNVIGVGLGFYISNKINHPGFASLFIIVSALLYLYASYLKGVVIVGNLLVATLVGFSLLIVGIFDLYPVINPVNKVTQATIFGIILDYALFAFYLNFIREIIKDIQDMNGDKNAGINTLPIILGKKRTLHVVFILGVIAVIGVVGYMYTYFYNTQELLLYFLLGVLAPLLYFCIKVYDAKDDADIAHLSLVLKITMFLGVCSLALYPFILK